MVAVHVDLSQPIAERAEPGSDLSRADSAAAQPVSKVRHRRRPVGAEVRDDHDRRRFVRFEHAGPPRARGLRSHEGHARSATRSETQVSLPCERLQQRSPSGAKRVTEMAQAGLRDDRRDQLFPREVLAFERFAGRGAQRIPVLGGHAEVAFPARQLPRAARCHERKQRAGVLRREQVERSAHRPGLDEPAVAQGARDLTGS